MSANNECKDCDYGLGLHSLFLGSQSGECGHEENEDLFLEGITKNKPACDFFVSKKQADRDD